jgi:hypothetical protein
MGRWTGAFPHLLGYAERHASSLKGATMPNGQKYEDWLKDKERRGEQAPEKTASDAPKGELAALENLRSDAFLSRHDSASSCM